MRSRPMRGALAILMPGALAFAVPARALAQSAGDEQYVDPFQSDQGGGQAQQPEPAPEQPAAPLPATEGEAEAAADAPAAESQATSPTLPHTGAPMLLFAAAGYALLLAGIAMRRQT